MVTIDELAAEVRALRVRLDATEAVLAIHELKARYADLVDRRFFRGAMVDADVVAALAEQIAGTFTPDGVWDGGKVLGRSRGRDAIAERMLTSTLTFSRHFFLKPHIRVDGDRATGRWDVLSPCTTPDGVAHWMCGYEDDVYVRDASGTWLHESMTMTTVFMAPANEGWHRIFA